MLYGSSQLYSEFDLDEDLIFDFALQNLANRLLSGSFALRQPFDTTPALCNCNTTICVHHRYVRGPRLSVTVSLFYYALLLLTLVCICILWMGCLLRPVSSRIRDAIPPQPRLTSCCRFGHGP